MSLQEVIEKSQKGIPYKGKFSRRVIFAVFRV